MSEVGMHHKDGVWQQAPWPGCCNICGMKEMQKHPPSFLDAFHIITKKSLVFGARCPECLFVYKLSVPVRADRTSMHDIQEHIPPLFLTTEDSKKSLMSTINFTQPMTKEEYEHARAYSVAVQAQMTPIVKWSDIMQTEISIDPTDEAVVSVEGKSCLSGAVA